MRALMATFLATALFIPGTVTAQTNCTGCGTNVPAGPVSGTWTKMGSPYCVQGTITVSDLTIQPGVCVRVAPGAEIVVQLRILAQGTAAEPVVFTPMGAAPWQGIRFQNALPSSVLEHCRISGSDASGLRIFDSTPTIRDCVIEGNTASRGGGIHAVIGTGDMLIEGCSIRDNSSSGNGGGVFIDMKNGFTFEARFCEFTENVANPNEANGNYWGGGILAENTDGHLVLDRCELRGNRVNSKCTSWNCDVSGWGGGVLFSGGDATMLNCAFIENRVRPIDGGVGGFEDNFGYGGGLYFDSSTGLLTLANCMFTGNTAFLSGSDPYAWGNAIYLVRGTADVLNCTVAWNGSITMRDTDALYLDSGTSAEIKNSIFFWNNQLTPKPTPTWGVQIAGAGTANVSYCCVQHNPYPGGGNMNANPGFLREGNEKCDMALASFSPCVDAGDSAFQFDDMCFPPSQGSQRNDMGMDGGPLACNWGGKGQIETYCTAKVNSCGSSPAISASGTPSASSTSGFVLSASGARGQKLGVVLYSTHGRGGPPYIPFQGGFLCIDTDLRRGWIAKSNQVPACNAQFSVDWNTYAQMSPDPCLRTVGQKINVQWWGRDTIPHGAFLSDGLEYTIGL